MPPDTMGGMDGDFEIAECDDAPEWLKYAAKATDNCLGRMRRARNKTVPEATEQDVEDARFARDLIRYIIKRASWRVGDGHSQ
jgi:hypothetical protein